MSKLLTAHQSGFWCTDSCVSQLLAIVHETPTDFDAANPNLKAHGAFSDMPKAFDSLACRINL